MMTECCDRSHKTPFCPYCGKQLCTNQPLTTLLAHVRHHASGLRTAADSARSQQNGGGSKAARRREIAAKKWEAWQVALTEVVTAIARATGEESTSE